MSQSDDEQAAAPDEGAPPAAAHRPTAAAQSAPKPDPSFVERVVNAVRSAATSLTGSKPSTDVRPAVVSEPVTDRPRTPRRRSAPTVGTNRPGVSDGAVTIRITELGGYPLHSLPSPPVATAEIPASGKVHTYSADDDDVVPPVLRRPVIPGPPAPDAPADSYAIFDLIVDPQGNVEQVKTVSAPSRYRDRMIVAHLKAWGFTPAMREGHAVRYRLRIRLIV
jgi:hypothetical protein